MENIKNTASLVSSTLVVSTQMPMIKAAGGAPLSITMKKNNRSHYGKSNPNYKHGMKRTKMYGRWCGMISRTTNPNVYAYKNYGERGIKVCSEWRYDFLAFYKWAITHGYEDGLEIDRKDNNGDYTPENCHFTTPYLNSLNRRRGIDYAIYPNFNRFYVLFSRKGERIYLGFFKTKEKARIARDEYLRNEIV